MFFRKKYHEKWDKKLNELIDNEDIQVIDEYTCVFNKSNTKVWIANYPNHFASPYDPKIKIYPSCKTKKRLYKIVKEKIDILEKQKTQQKLKQLFGE